MDGNVSSIVSYNKDYLIKEDFISYRVVGRVVINFVPERLRYFYLVQRSQDTLSFLLYISYSPDLRLLSLFHPTKSTKLDFCSV